MLMIGSYRKLLVPSALKRLQLEKPPLERPTERLEPERAHAALPSQHDHV